MRHAETVYNVRGLVSGDPGNSACVLSDSGVEQARSLACELVAVPFDLCLTSELRRVLAVYSPGVPPEKLPELATVTPV